MGQDFGAGARLGGVVGDGEQHDAPFVGAGELGHGLLGDRAAFGGRQHGQQVGFDRHLANGGQRDHARDQGGGEEGE